LLGLFNDLPGIGPWHFLRFPGFSRIWVQAAVTGDLKPASDFHFPSDFWVDFLVSTHSDLGLGSSFGPAFIRDFQRFLGGFPGSGPLLGLFGPLLGTEKTHLLNPDKISSDFQGFAGTYHFLAFDEPFAALLAFSWDLAFFNEAGIFKDLGGGGSDNSCVRGGTRWRRVG
jgi:hypothetical protein